MFLALLEQCHQALTHLDLWQICYDKNALTAASSLVCLVLGD